MTTADTATPRRRVFRVVAALAGWAARVRRAAPRPIGWWLDKPQRLTALAWMVALLLVGCARMSWSDPIIVGPDLAHGGAKTLFERFGVFDYKLLVKPSDEATGWLHIQAGMLHAIGWINSLLLWAFLGLLYGGLTLLEWFLNLSLYEDSAPQIDQAVQMMADHVFWPLIGATAATGAFIAYAKWRGEGRGFLTDLLWVIAAASLATGFALGPSTLVGELNSVRQDMGQGVIAGASQFTTTTNDPVGYGTPQLTGDAQTVATRKLVTGLWSTFGATPWCYAQFRDLDICRQAGKHALANDRTWQSWMDDLEDGQTPAVFQDKGDYIRGQDPTRTGVLLMLAALTVPLSYMLVRLIIAGLVAVVGLLLMLVVGLLFLTFWPIEGFFRRVGTQYWLYTLGLLLQALFITVVIAGIMVTSSIITTQAGQYGFFLVAVLNGVLMYSAVKARSWLETLTSVGGAGSSGIASALIARSVTRTVIKGVAGMVTGGTGTVASALGWMHNKTQGAGWGRQGRASADQPWNKSSGKPSVGLDSGPIKASSTRTSPPGTGQLPGQPSALPTGSTPSGPGSAPPTPPPSGAPSPGGGAPPSGGGSSSPNGSGGAGTATQPRAASWSGQVVDGHVTDRQAPSPREDGQSRRVWAAPPGGRGTAPLDNPPPSSGSSSASSQSRSRRWFRRRS